MCGWSGSASSWTRLAGERGLEEPFADGRLPTPRTVVVGRATDGRSDGARRIGPHELIGDRRPDPAVRARGAGRQVLGQRAVDGAVGVEVVGVDDPGPGRGSARQHASHEWWQELGPAVVGRRRRVIDDRCARHRAACLDEVGEVGLDRSRPRPAGPRCDGERPTERESHDRPAGRSGPARPARHRRRRGVPARSCLAPGSRWVMSTVFTSAYDAP